MSRSATSTCFLNISRDGDSTTALGSLLNCDQGKHPGAWAAPGQWAVPPAARGWLEPSSLLLEVSSSYALKPCSPVSPSPKSLCPHCLVLTAEGQLLLSENTNQILLSPCIKKLSNCSRMKKLILTVGPRCPLGPGLPGVPWNKKETKRT